MSTHPRQKSQVPRPLGNIIKMHLEARYPPFSLYTAAICATVSNLKSAMHHHVFLLHSNIQYIQVKVILWNEEKRSLCEVDSVCFQLRRDGGLWYTIALLLSSLHYWCSQVVNKFLGKTSGLKIEIHLAKSSGVISKSIYADDGIFADIIGI